MDALELDDYSSEGDDEESLPDISLPVPEHKDKRKTKKISTLHESVSGGDFFPIAE